MRNASFEGTEDVVDDEESELSMLLAGDVDDEEDDDEVVDDDELSEFDDDEENVERVDNIDGDGCMDGLLYDALTFSCCSC